MAKQLTMHQLYQRYHALLRKGLTKGHAAATVVKQTGQRLSDGKPVGSPVFPGEHRPWRGTLPELLEAWEAGSLGGDFY